MKNLFILGIIVLALGLGFAHAAPAQPSGTLAIASGSQLHLGGTVTFDWTASDIKPNNTPRIQVVCYQSGQIVYSEAMNAEGNSFILGGGSSPWLANGGAADCEAQLYYWAHVLTPKQTYVPLSGVLAFHAEASP